MDIKDFIISSVSQIVDASKELNEQYNGQGVKIAEGTTIYGVNRSSIKKAAIINVSYELATTVSESDTKNGGAEIKVASLFSAGGTKDKSSENEAISKISFILPLTMPKIP